MCKLRESFFAFGMFELRSFPQIENLTNLFPIRELRTKTGRRADVVSRANLGGILSRPLSRAITLATELEKAVIWTDRILLSCKDAFVSALFPAYGPQNFPKKYLPAQFAEIRISPGRW